METLILLYMIAGFIVSSLFVIYVPTNPDYSLITYFICGFLIWWAYLPDIYSHYTKKKLNE